MKQITELDNDDLLETLEQICVQSEFSDEDSITIMANWLGLTVTNAALLSLLRKGLIRVGEIVDGEPSFVSNTDKPVSSLIDEINSIGENKEW